MKIQKYISKNGKDIWYFIKHQNENENVAEVNIDYCVYEKDGGCVCNVYVREKSRHRGFAKRLMQHIIEQHPTDLLYLTVNKNNKNIKPDRLVEFYRTFGFISDTNNKYSLYRNKL